LRVEGSLLRVKGLEFRVSVSKLKGWALWLRLEVLGLRLKGLGLGLG